MHANVRTSSGHTDTSGHCGADLSLLLGQLLLALFLEPRLMLRAIGRENGTMRERHIANHMRAEKRVFVSVTAHGNGAITLPDKVRVEGAASEQSHLLLLLGLRAPAILLQLRLLLLLLPLRAWT